MEKRSLTIDLSEAFYQQIARSVQAGEFESESDAIESAVLQFLIAPGFSDKEQAAHDNRIEEQLRAVVEEADEHPDDIYTANDVPGSLIDQRIDRYLRETVVPIARQIEQQPESGRTPEQVEAVRNQAREERARMASTLRQHVA